MLIKFKSEQSGDFVMMSDVALPLLKMMGASGKSEGAVSAEQLRNSLARLESALAQLPSQDEEQDDDEAEASVPLAARASPLLAMLRKAAAEDGYVMWQKD